MALAENFNKEELNNLIALNAGYSTDAGLTSTPNPNPQMLTDDGQLNPLWVEKYGTAETAEDAGDANDGGGVLPEGNGIVKENKEKKKTTDDLSHNKRSKYSKFRKYEKKK
tara:strand:- start:52 stop:384 length:333 start_codon:yes stop_codon:yes gene_type:complete